MVILPRKQAVEGPHGVAFQLDHIFHSVQMLGLQRRREQFFTFKEVTVLGRELDKVTNAE